MRNISLMVEILVSIATVGSPVIDLIEADIKPEHLLWSDVDGHTCSMATTPGSDARWNVWDYTDGGYGSHLDDAELDRWMGEHHINPRSATNADEVATVMAPWCFI